MSDSPDAAGGRIVVIDDDEATRQSLEQMLSLRGHEVKLFASAEPALGWPGLSDVDCVVTDVKMPGMDGEAFLAEVGRRDLPAPVVMITGHGDIAMAVRCLKAGAYDFVEKPFDDEVLLASIGRAIEKVRLRRDREELRRRLELVPGEDDGRFGMIGRSRAMMDLYARIEVAARSDAPVVITGETGVGKELVAHAIHGASRRRHGAFVPVNAGAIAESTMESELFGHARGAFTGAISERAGKLVSASGGTLFLDEIECISERAQIQLLRVLEDGMVYPVGQDAPAEVDVRLLVTTNVDLEEEVRLGRIREDFYHRISVLGIGVPRLRERLEDVPLLVSRFLKQAARRHGVPVPEVPDATLSLFLRYPWPGNVRELKHAVERMTITAHDGIAGPPHLRDEGRGEQLLSLPATPGPLRDELEGAERRAIETFLRRFEGEVGVTAQALGISRRALYERMKKYDLAKEDFRP